MATWDVSSRMRFVRAGAAEHLDFLRYCGFVRGPSPRNQLLISRVNTAEGILAFTAAEMIVEWANFPGPLRGGMGGRHAARPTPVAENAQSAALLLACKGCVVSLVRGGVLVSALDQGAGYCLLAEDVAPVTEADGYAIAAAVMSCRAVWLRATRTLSRAVPMAMEETGGAAVLVAARAPIAGVEGAPASELDPPVLLNEAVQFNPGLFVAVRAPSSPATSLASHPEQLPPSSQASTGTSRAAFAPFASGPSRERPSAAGPSRSPKKVRFTSDTLSADVPSNPGPSRDTERSSSPAHASPGPEPARKARNASRGTWVVPVLSDATTPAAATRQGASSSCTGSEPEAGEGAAAQSQRGSRSRGKQAARPVQPRALAVRPARGVAAAQPHAPSTTRRRAQQAAAASPSPGPSTAVQSPLSSRRRSPRLRKQ